MTTPPILVLRTLLYHTAGWLTCVHPDNDCTRMYSLRFDILDTMWHGIDLAGGRAQVVACSFFKILSFPNRAAQWLIVAHDQLHRIHEALDIKWLREDRIEQLFPKT